MMTGVSLKNVSSDRPITGVLTCTWVGLCIICNGGSKYGIAPCAQSRSGFYIMRGWVNGPTGQGCRGSKHTLPTKRPTITTKRHGQQQEDRMNDCFKGPVSHSISCENKSLKLFFGHLLTRYSLLLPISSTLYMNRNAFSWPCLLLCLAPPFLNPHTHIYIWPRLCACAVLTVLQMTTYRVNMLHSPPDPTWPAAEIMWHHRPRLLVLWYLSCSSCPIFWNLHQAEGKKCTNKNQIITLWNSFLSIWAFRFHTSHLFRAGKLIQFAPFASHLIQWPLTAVKHALAGRWFY